MIAKFLQWVWKMIPIKGKIFTAVICGLVIIVLMKQIPTHDTFGFRLFMVLMGVLMMMVTIPAMIKLIGYEDRRRSPKGPAELRREDEQDPKGSYIPQNVIRPVSRRWPRKGGDDA